MSHGENALADSEQDTSGEQVTAEPAEDSGSAVGENALDGAVVVDGAVEDAAPEETPAEPTVADLEFEGDVAADYIEGLLDVADLDGDIDMDVEGDRAVVSVVGATLDELVGDRGEVLDALQELTRLAVHRQTGGRTRLMLDIGGYRARRRVDLSELGATAVSITHDMASTRKIADRVAMIYKGKIIWTGHKDEIDHSKNEFVDQFINGRATGPISMEVRAP